MKYTYQISFTGFDYSDLFFTNQPEMKGAWVEGTMIWREKINELKINKHLNASTYDTLNTWFTDPTKFTTKIWVKVLNNSVQESLHWFGIKWGTIDINLTNYNVEPELDDLYENYLLNNWNNVGTDLTPIEYTMRLVSHTGYYPIVYYLGTRSDTYPEWNEILETFIKNKINDITGLATTEIVSAILFGDNYEDGTPCATENGMLLDYVTLEYNVFKYSTITADGKTWKATTLKDVFDMLQLFQIYAFFDSNNKLRFEHISWFIHEIEANTIIIDTHPTEQTYTYNIKEIVNSEKIDLAEFDDDETLDADWDELKITYSEVRNRADILEKTYTFSKYFTNLGYYYPNIANISSYFLLSAGFSNVAMNWQNVDIDSFASDRNYLTLAANLAKSCVSTNFESSPGDLNYSIHVDVIVDDWRFAVHRRSDGAAISDVILINTTGDHTGVFTVSEGVADAYIVCYCFAVGSVFEGWIVAEYTGTAIILTNPWATGAKSTTAVMNGDFSKANILYNYWRDYRLSLSGTMNGTLQAFLSTQYNLERKDVKQFFSTIPNPLHGIFDNNRIGRILGWTRNLDTGYIDLILKYQEDDGRVFLTDDQGNLLTDVDGNPLIE